MEQWNLWDESSFRYTDFIYTFKNGSYIELFGLEDPDKAKGPARDILFVNEANLISKALFDQVKNLPGVGALLSDIPGSAEILRDFNNFILFFFLFYKVEIQLW